ncbi:MAG: hypothetical protein CMH26_09215 [Micavibrio sp.]|nr:hypothetical protein [Micavibrio sp.]|tara:strand:+ start:377 stop:607 length:231 start_codon:yes stop_codon:yes gene_type:complete
MVSPLSEKSSSGSFEQVANGESVTVHDDSEYVRLNPTKNNRSWGVDEIHPAGEDVTGKVNAKKQLQTACANYQINF